MRTRTKTDGKIWSFSAFRLSVKLVISWNKWVRQGLFLFFQNLYPSLPKTPCSCCWQKRCNTDVTLNKTHLNHNHLLLFLVNVYSARSTLLAWMEVAVTLILAALRSTLAVLTPPQEPEGNPFHFLLHLPTYFLHNMSVQQLLFLRPTKTVQRLNETFACFCKLCGRR